MPLFWIKFLEEHARDAPDEVAELEDYFYSLMENPLNLNTASAEELRSIRLLSEFQIQSLLDYRQEHGPIVSYLELSLLDGFNLELSQFLKSVSFLGESSKEDFLRKSVPHYEVLMKSQKKISSDTRTFQYLPAALPFSFYLRYRMKYANQVQVGFTLENDDGENIYPDFVSAYLHMKNIFLFRRRSSGLKLESLILGDFNVRLGQGLILWNAFSMSSLSEPSSLVRKGSGTSPYTASDEERFFRGGATCLSWKNRIFWGGFCSVRRKDARIIGDTFVSRPLSGLHNTVSSLETRDRLKEELYGLYCSYVNERWKIGLNMALFAYDRKDGRDLRPDLKYQRFEGWWGNVSVDMIYSYRGRRYFLEAALDRGGALAFLAGTVLPLGSDLEMGLLGRFYQKKYIAPFAGAYARNTQVANEYGLLFNMKYRFRRRWTLCSAVDVSYHPAERYRVPAKSCFAKMQHAVSGQISENQELRFRCVNRWLLHERSVQADLKVDYRMKLLEDGRGWIFSSFLGLSGSLSPEKIPSGGWAIYQDVGYVYDDLSGFLRVTAFHVDNWTDRIYCYERDLPHSFSVPALYGRGMGVSMLFKVRLFRKMDFGCKIHSTWFPNKMQKNTLRLKFLFQLRF